MFEKPHHQRIRAALRCLHLDALHQARCFFGGGTAIALQINEYRQSDDIDFLCNDAKGYQSIQEAVFYHGKDALCLPGTEMAGDIRRSREAIRFFLNPDGEKTPIKVEIIREGYLAPFLSGRPFLDTHVLQPIDLIATKLLANADRGLGSERHFRDYFDIIMACTCWKSSAAAGFEKAREAYNTQAAEAVKRVHTRLQLTPSLVETAFEALKVTENAQRQISRFLEYSPDRALRILSDPTEEVPPLQGLLPGDRE